MDLYLKEVEDEEKHIQNLLEHGNVGGTRTFRTHEVLLNKSVDNTVPVYYRIADVVTFLRINPHNAVSKEYFFRGSRTPYSQKLNNLKFQTFDELKAYLIMNFRL